MDDISRSVVFHLSSSIKSPAGSLPRGFSARTVISELICVAGIVLHLFPQNHLLPPRFGIVAVLLYPGISVRVDASTGT